MGRRHILHCDMNCFYASVEMQRHPELRNKPLAVCGSQEERHGIVLTANYIAKPYGVKTGMAIWQAKQRCPDLVTLPPDMDEYTVRKTHSVAPPKSWGFLHLPHGQCFPVPAAPRSECAGQGNELISDLHCPSHRRGSGLGSGSPMPCR